MIRDRPAHQVEDIADVSCEYRRGPLRELVRRQLRKQLIGGTRAGWALFVFQFQDRLSGGQWAPPRVSIQRWRKVDGFWRPVTRVNLKLGRATQALAAAAAFEASWEAVAAALDREEAAEARLARIGRSSGDGLGSRL